MLLGCTVTSTSLPIDNKLDKHDSQSSMTDKLTNFETESGVWQGSYR